MSISRSFLKGWSYVWKVRSWLLLIFLLQFAVLLFPGFAMKNTLQRSMGKSLAAEKMLQSYDSAWQAIFSKNASGLKATFSPAVSGAGSLLEPLNGLVSGRLWGTWTLLLAFGLVYWLLWIFFSGGLISRFQNTPPNRGFFADAGRYFWRIFAVAVLAGIGYWLVFSSLLPWLGGIVRALTRETVDERVHFAYTLAKYLIVWLIALSINLLADYAKVHIVTLDLRNPLLGIAKAVTFVAAHPLKTFGLYFLVGLVWLVSAALYAVLVPGAAHSSWGMILFTFLFGQLYIFWRIALRAEFWAAETALVQRT